MSCLYANYRVWPPGFKDEKLQNVHKMQHELHHRENYLKHCPESKWHGQATYNLAVRQEMRKRGFAVRMS